ncbi:MAG: hypothetical protein L6R42_008968 [Xanthoria sp. 1 TBL-2021]|nr:MAG: hypothetical protein L6R42_008968 [Xanthoria sp. 1 TBL-2021]
MDPPYQSIQDSFLRDDDANPVEDGNEAKRDLVTHAHREPAKKRRRYNPRKTRAEWDQIKAVVKKLYVDDDCSLEEIMTDLQANRGFEASKDQFKSKIREWKFDKNVKTEEMKHIVRIETRRLPKKTDFRVRNQRGSPSSDLIASPQLSNVGWYTSYKEYRNNSPEYSFHPVFQNLKKLRIQEDTYELRMFNMSKIKESFLITEKVFPQDFIGEDSTIGGNNDCLGCTLKEGMLIYDVCRTTYDNDPSSLSAEPNLLLWVSEISRLLQSKVERINIHMIWLLMEWSLSNRCVNAVDVFYDIGLEMCRAKKSEDWLEIHYALDMVDSLMFRGRFLAGKTLLRAILKEEFHIIDTPRQNRVPHPKWDKASMQSLYWRRGTTQLDVIRWFLAHPDLTHKIFGDDDIPNFSLGSGPALLDVNLHFCFSGGEDWTEEDDITRDLMGERVCDKDVQLHMFIMLALSHTGNINSMIDIKGDSLRKMKTKMRARTKTTMIRTKMKTA